MTTSTETEKRLTNLAGEIRTIDPEAACRLDSLSRAISASGNPQGWGGIDVLAAVDPTGIAARMKTVTIGHRGLAMAEMVRNALALMPILLTWLGLFVATTAYRTAVNADPALLGRPFLLLWEEGFGGHLPPPASFLTLSHVALLDVVIIGLMLLLTVHIQRKEQFDQVQRDRDARDTEASVRQASWQAALIIAERTSPMAYIDQFQQANEALLNELRAERERLKELTTQREHDASDLNRFVKQFQEGTSQMAQSMNEVKVLFNTMTAMAEALDQRTAELVRQQQSLGSDLQYFGTTVKQHDAALGQAAQDLRKTTELVDANMQGFTTSTVELCSHVDDFRHQVKDLQAQFVNERTAYQEASKQAAQSASDLTAAMQATRFASQTLEKSTNAMQAMLKPVENVEQSLTHAATEQLHAGTTLVASAQAIDQSSRTLEATAQTVQTLKPDVHALVKAVSDLQKQVQVVVKGAPTTQVLTDAWQDMQKAWESELKGLALTRGASGGSGGRWWPF